MSMAINYLNQVTFKSGVSDKNRKVKSIEIDWEALDGKAETDIDGNYLETWTKYHIIYNITLVSDYSFTEWLITEFLPSKNKQIKIYDKDAGAYITVDVVMQENSLSFKHLKKLKYYSEIELPLIRKSPVT